MKAKSSGRTGSRVPRRQKSQSRSRTDRTKPSSSGKSRFQLSVQPSVPSLHKPRALDNITRERAGTDTFYNDLKLRDVGMAIQEALDASPGSPIEFDPMIARMISYAMLDYADVVERYLQ